MAKEIKTAKTSKREQAHRVLPIAGITLIDSSVFDTLQPKTKTEIITAANGNVEFLANFRQMKDPRYLRDALLSGKDVSRALEFNDITLTEDERDAMKAVVPILEKIGAIQSPYPWLNGTDTLPTNITVQSATVTRGARKMTKVKLKKYWKKCSAYWGGLTNLPPVFPRHQSGNSWNRESHNVSVSMDGIRIGCQEITRQELEAVARHLNWEPTKEA